MRPRLNEKSCGLLVVDLQEKFVPVIRNWDSTVAMSIRLIRFFQLIQAPILVTEQYPKGLGATVAAVREALGTGSSPALTKTTFSSCGAEDLKKAVAQTGKRQWVVCGIEAHVCVLQTALDLRDLGHDVFLAVDAVSSRHVTDGTVALEGMARAGAVLSTSESLIFEALRDAKHPVFKQASALVK